MIADYVAQLRLPISGTRLESYRAAGGTDLDMVVNYMWNIELSEALYPSLQAVEVSLRNGIHAGAMAHYDSEFWFDRHDVLLPVQRRKIQEARDELARRGKPNTSGRVIAAMLGFWMHLFDRPYEHAPSQAPHRLSWHDDHLALLDAVFPNAPRRARNREAIRRRCNAIRDLRNRVFHYEAVWNRPRLAQEHAAILEFIGWISPSMRTTIELCDRFTLINEGGRRAVREKLLMHIEDVGM